MLKSLIINKTIKKEMNYLLELSSIEWDVKSNIRNHKIAVIAKNGDEYIEVEKKGNSYQTLITPDESEKSKELKRIAVGIKLILENVL